MKIDIPNETGSLFKNANKTSPKHPDYTGKVRINGKIMRIAGWRKTISKGPHTGDTYLSLKFSEDVDSQQPYSKQRSNYEL